jgi:two-component system response regulator FixJ
VVIIVDDDAALRDSLRWLFESVRLGVLAFESAQAFLAASPIPRVGCILLDVRMPGASGLELQAKLAELRLDLPVIMMTGHADVRMAVRALKAGAFDFVEKPINDQDLIETVWRAVRSSETAAQQNKRQSERARRLEALSEREREVLEQVVAGEPNKRIAVHLGISEKTVEYHRANVMRKLECRTMADLIRTFAVGASAKD